jgi:hypothetical protein
MSLILRDLHNGPLALGVTVSKAISFIVEALEDPLNPRWCAPCITACIMVLMPDPDGDDTDEIGNIISRNHLFCSTIVAFLTAKRSIAAIEKLSSRWSKCSCSHADIIDHGLAMPIHQLVARMHILADGDPRFGKDSKIYTLKTITRNFAQFFEDAVKKVKRSSIAKGRHPEIWPATLKDIIPYGEQRQQL